jgi:hypothetical protein
MEGSKNGIVRAIKDSLGIAIESSMVMERGLKKDK